MNKKLEAVAQVQARRSFDRFFYLWVTESRKRFGDYRIRIIHQLTRTYTCVDSGHLLYATYAIMRKLLFQFPLDPSVAVYFHLRNNPLAVECS